MKSPTAQDVSNVATITAGLLASGVMSRSFYDPELAQTVVTHALAIYADINARLADGEAAQKDKA